jgi:HSP20 family protein
MAPEAEDGRWWQEVNILRRGADRLFDPFQGYDNPIRSPHIGAAEREDDQFIIRANFPGLTKDDVTVEVTHNELIITGGRRNKLEATFNEADGLYYGATRPSGSFQLSIPLPGSVNTENIRASLRNGLLEIRMQATRHPGVPTIPPPPPRFTL